MKFVKILLLSVVMLAIAFGCAWAEDFDWDAPRLAPRHITHASMVDGKSVYVSDDKGASKPSFFYNIIHLSKIPAGQSGEMNIDLGGKANVDFYRESIEYIYTKHYPAGWTNFKVWEWAESPANYFAGDENGIVAEFVVNSVSEDITPEPETEEAISERDFNFTVGNVSTTGKTGKIHTTDAQMASGCVPYMEMVADGTTLTGLKWKFIDPSDTSKKEALVRNNKNTLAEINSITIVASDRITEDYYGLSKTIEVGDPIKGELDLQKTWEISDIRCVIISFYLEDSLTSNCMTRYDWRFYLVDQPSPDPAPQPDPATPTAEEVAAAKTAVSNDLGKDIEVVAADKAKITTGSKITFGNMSSAITSSAIAVSQNLDDEGGAVVLATELFMPLNNISLNGTALDMEKYQVMKYFENGGGIDLLERYGKIFSESEVDGVKGVKLNAAIVIIDGPVPSGETGVIQPLFGDGKYGVKLSDDDKYLYIWDGIMDGVAKDPIALVKAEENNDTGSSSSGCNAAGFGILALVSLVAASRLFHKK